MDINEILPGSTTDPFSWDKAEGLTLKQELELAQTAKDLGFFEHAKSEYLIDEDSIERAAHDRLTAPPKVKQAVKVTNIAGLVSSTPLAIQIPDDCRFVKIESAGRVWLSLSNSVIASSTETLDACAGNFAVAVCGAGDPKIWVRPWGVKTIYVSADPANTQVSMAFISGELEYKDIR